MFKFKIAAKFFAVLAVLAVALVALGAVGLKGLGTVKQGADNVSQVSRETNLDSRTWAQLQDLKARMYLYIGTADGELRKTLKPEVDGLIKELETDLGTMRDWYAERPADLKLTLAQYEPFLKIREIWNSGGTEVHTAADRQRALAAIRGIVLPMNKAGKELNVRDGQLTTEATEAATASYRAARLPMVVIMIISLLAGLGIVLWLIRNVTPRIKAYATFSRRIAGGDLTSTLDVRGADEIADLGSSLNQMVEQLSSQMRRLIDSADAIGAGSTEIVAAASQQAAAASQQSASVSETTAAVEQLRATAHHAAEKAAEVTRQAAAAAQAGDEGAHAVQEIVAGMDEISKRVQEIATGIEELSTQSEQIASITATVSDLADQSNLLALNATIEAAKAGEMGKGFAVVADEVRNLAEQSKQATAQVQGVLEEITKASATAVRAAQAGTSVVAHGSTLASRAGEIIQQLVETGRQTDQAAQQIAATAQQQNVGMDQIASAMKQTTEVTTEFVAGSEQAKLAATQLEDVARSLQDVAASYRL